MSSRSRLSLLRRKIRLSHVLLGLFLFVFVTSFPSTPSSQRNIPSHNDLDSPGLRARSASKLIRAPRDYATRSVHRLKDKFKTISQAQQQMYAGEAGTRAMGTAAARTARKRSLQASASPKIEVGRGAKQGREQQGLQQNANSSVFASPQRETRRSRPLNGGGDDYTAAQRPLGFPAPPQYCTPLEYTQGFWQRREQGAFTSLDELRDAFSLDPKHHSMGCHPLNWPIESKGDPKLDVPEHVERILDTSSWTYLPGAANGATCDRKELVRDDFVKLLLRSRTGLVLVGDSLTEQHYGTIRNILIHEGGPFYVEGWGNRPRYEGIKMNRDHPEAKRLLELAGVDAARADWPIVSLYLERHLLTRNEMNDAFHDVEAYQASLSGPGMDPWIAESIWWEHYEKIMRTHRVQFLPGADVREEPGILVLSSGPHWINTQFGTVENPVKEEDVMKAWRRMLVRINTKIRDFSEAEHSVFWRSTAPGHPHCELSRSGAENRTDFRSTHDPNFKRYNWEDFEVYNQEVREFVRYDEHASSPARTPPGKRIQYLDIWPIAVQRPDAHLLPPNDCLHFCYQTVMEEWTKMLWHIVGAQAHNPDYRGKDKVYKM